MISDQKHTNNDQVILSYKECVIQISNNFN